MKKEETFDFHIKSCWHSISRMYNQKAAQEDITASIGYVLINIHSKDGTPATKIAPMLGLETRSLTRVLKSMEDKGLIEKRPDPLDRRSVRIFLTELGRQKKGKSVETVMDFNQKVQKALTEKELKSFFRIFRKINDVIHQNQKSEF
ncbi:MAG: winged helix-turn-helix transcriptional regulator [Lunatimonas sp.]|uniref:MarR family winged helix-turn-helix transcriptional regulator n=1 Tax=Lunatimonas sp. TaxID=2060141 RepID=UPI00263B93EC|nr:MarR family winged helix-turn-helix transcriptional regulator [Lunatimonas sp.]MCC5937437.1 winged helix-turn-helix transcriptional regulator [Lunatimonas sp.]